MSSTGTLRLTKHHGAGNDFLVLLDADASRPLRAEEVRALCDRHRGVGADGVIRGTRYDADGDGALRMELYNGDGSAAEMSGNGIRCLAQAAVDAGWVTEGVIAVATGAGPKAVEYRSGPGLGAGFATVAMGTAVLGLGLAPDQAPGVRAARAVDMGNPHVVLLFDGPVQDAVVADTGARLERSTKEGANVEFVWALSAEPAVLEMRVWERGVGETLACGTGSCAAAAAASSWGLGGTRFIVHNPGGALEVELRDEGVWLGGPTVQVARVEVEEEVLATCVAALSDGHTAAGARARAEVNEVAAGR